MSAKRYSRWLQQFSSLFSTKLPHRARGRASAHTNSCRPAQVAQAIEQLESRLLLTAYTVTNLNDSGSGSLRDAIDQANSNTGADTIQFASNLSGTITLTSGQLTLSDTSGATTIQGLGAGQLKVSANNSGRVFEVEKNVTAQISGLTISNGSNSGSNRGGGILNEGTLTLSNSVVSGNRSDVGGGISNTGNLTIASSTITGNTADNTDGVYDSPGGGGIYNSNGANLTISYSTISSNTVDDSDGGGGIMNAGTLTITNSTFNDNYTEGLGGGIYNNEVGNLVLTNCTFSANTAAEGAGGLFNEGDLFHTGVANLTNCTFSGNSKVTDTNSGAAIDNTGSLILNFNIIANSVGGTDLSNHQTMSGEYNLIEQGDTDNLFNTITGQDPLLGALQDNGGPTLTFALLAGSPAINRGYPISSTLATDQRGAGYSRDVNGYPDLGAYELQTAPVYTVTNLNDSGQGSLRQAIASANSSIGDDVIVFDASLAGEIVLTSGELELYDYTGTTTIQGSGADKITVRGSGGGWSVFEIRNTSPDGEQALVVSISGLTISGGDAVLHGGGIYNYGGTLTLADCVISDNTSGSDGGGISNDGILNMTNVIITNNSANNIGGGVHNKGTLTINGGAIRDNSAVTYGFGGGIANEGIVSINSTTLDGNSAAFGGGIHNQGGRRSGVLTITNSTLSNNISRYTAGGIGNDGTATIINSTFSGNSSFIGGGGVSNAATMSITNSTISGNTSKALGGGLYNSGTLTLNNTIIANSPQGLDVYNQGTMTGSNNLIENGNSTGLSNTITGQDPSLGALQDNGGPTWTQALMAGSVAVNAGNNSLAVDSSGNALTTDQRGSGFARILNGQVDLGAFESNYSATPTVTATLNPRTGELVITDRGVASRSTVGIRGEADGTVSVWIDNTGDSQVDTQLGLFQKVKAIKVTLGDGENTLYVAGQLQLKRGLTVIGGRDADRVYFVNGDGSTTGFLGFQTPTRMDVDVNLQLQDGDNVVKYDGISFQKNVTIRLGGGNDQVSGVAASFAKLVNMNLGRGDDTLSHANNTFAWPAIINLGEGNDVYTETSSSFKRLWLVDGGRGTDTIDRQGSSARAKIHLGFESTAPTIAAGQGARFDKQVYGTKRDDTGTGA